MKKMKVFLVGMLTLILSLCCLSGCALFKVGKYQAVEYKVLGFSKEIEDSESFVELKLDMTAVVSIDISAANAKWEGEGTWEEGEDDTIIITVNDVEHTVRMEDGQMILDLVVAEIVLER